MNYGIGIKLLIYPQRNVSQVRCYLSGSFALNNSFLPGVNRGLGSICEVQLAQYVADMALDRADADHKVVSDFLVGKTPGDQGQNLQSGKWKC